MSKLNAYKEALVTRHLFPPKSVIIQNVLNATLTAAHDALVAELQTEHPWWTQVETGSVVQVIRAKVLDACVDIHNVD